MTPKTTSRRDFLTRSSAAATALTFGLAATSSAAPGANARLRLGFIGVGNRGSQLLRSFMKHDDMQVAAICDVYKPYLTREDAFRSNKSAITTIRATAAACHRKCPSVSTSRTQKAESM